MTRIKANQQQKASTQSDNWSVKWRRMEKEREIRIRLRNNENKVMKASQPEKKTSCAALAMDREPFLATTKGIESVDVIKMHLDDINKYVDEECNRLTIQDARSLLAVLDESYLQPSTMLISVGGFDIKVDDARYLATSTIENPSMAPQFFKRYLEYDDEQMLRVRALRVRGIEILEKQIPDISKEIAFSADDIEEFCEMAWSDIQNVPPYCGLSIPHIFKILAHLRKSIADPDLEHDHSFYRSHIDTYSLIAWEMFVTNWSAKGRRLFDCTL